MKYYSNRHKERVQARRVNHFKTQVGTAVAMIIVAVLWMIAIGYVNMLPTQ